MLLLQLQVLAQQALVAGTLLTQSLLHLSGVLICRASVCSKFKKYKKKDFLHPEQSDFLVRDGGEGPAPDNCRLCSRICWLSSSFSLFSRLFFSFRPAITWF